MTDEAWENKIDESFEKFDLETIKFSFEQAEKMLAALTSITESFKWRSTTILAFLAPAITTTIGVAFLNASDPYIYLPLSMSGVFLLVAAFLSLMIINTKKSAFIGCAPKHIIDPVWTKYSDQLKLVIWNECKSYQEKINKRIGENDKCGNLFMWVTGLLFATPLAALVTYSLLLCF